MARAAAGYPVAYTVSVDGRVASDQYGWYASRGAAQLAADRVDRGEVVRMRISRRVAAQLDSPEWVCADGAEAR
jgi:hypothetical protein